MSQPPFCPKCGQPLPADAPAGLCPKCLVQAGFASGPEPTVTSPGSAGFVAPSVEALAGRFPQLEILELVGQGGMGAVYKARQPGLDRLVAVKILPPEVGRDPAFAERFTREARALARLSHPHIVAVHDFGQADGLYYFVMEFIDGANLRQAMQAGHLEPEQALAVVPQICDALQYAHDEGVVHRDIKPENILLDKRGRVKIADFGLSKLVAGGGRQLPDLALTGSHQVMGTIRYMAPEQMEGSKAVDHRADIYSLGVVFYEMLTGELPLGRFAPPSHKVEVDVRLDEVVLRSLEREPDRRYQQASQIKTEVQTIAARPVDHGAFRSAPAPSKPEPAHRAFPGPWRIGSVVLLLWLLGWLFAGAMLSFREPGVAIAGVVMLTIGYFVLRRTLSYFPAKPGDPREPGIMMLSFNHATALVMFTLGYLALIAAHYPLWEQPWLHSGAGTVPAAFRERYQGQEHHLIRGLAAFRDEIPRVELVAQGAFFEMRSYSTLFNIVCGCVLVAGAVATMLDAIRFRASWRLYGAMTAAHTATILIALLLANMVPSFTSLIQVTRLDDGSLFIGGGASASSLRREVKCHATSEQVAATIKAWMESHGYQVAYRSEWQLDTVPAGKTVGLVRVLGARKPAGFDTIRMTWRGPLRLVPVLDVRSVSSVSPAETHVLIDAGLARSDWGEAESWAPLLDSLEQALRESHAK